MQQKEFNKTIPNLPDPIWIVVHHGAGQLDFNGVNELHKTWKMPDGSIVPGLKSSLGYYCGYGWFIEKTGKLYQARRDNEEQAACRGFNKCSVNIGLQGDFEKEQPTKWQLESLHDLIGELQEKYKIPNKNIVGHRELSQTTCPGKNLFSWLVKNFPNSNLGRIEIKKLDKGSSGMG